MMYDYKPRNIPSRDEIVLEIRDLFGIAFDEASQITDLFYDNALYVAEKSYRKKLADSIVAYCFDERDYHRSKMTECVEIGDVDRAQDHQMLLKYYERYMFDITADSELYYPDSREDVMDRLWRKYNDKKD